MAKVFFIYFDLHTGYYPSFHHGLAYLIGQLKKEGNEVLLAHLTDEKDFSPTKNRIQSDRPDVIGLSFTTNQRKYVHRFLNKTKFIAKLIIAGGVHCSLKKEEVFNEFSIMDGICMGEGEVPLKELCRRLDNNENYFSTPSFIFKKGDEIVKNHITPLELIDNLPYPDYSLFNYHEIILESSHYFSMMLGRGCPYNCHYCCNHAIKQIYPNKSEYVRLPTVSHAIEIIKNNLLLYPNTQKIIFEDDTFTLNKKWLFEFCAAYKEEINLPFFCNARVENIDYQVAHHLKIANCKSINYGVESGSEWLRKHILNRNHSNKKIKEAFNITKECGIKTFSFNVIGLPFETKNMAENTFNLNLALKPDFGKCFYFYPYPGTKIYDLCLGYDLLLNDLESVSGYLEAPCIKETFMTHEEMIKNFELMHTFFYARVLFSKLRMWFLLENILLKIVFFLRKPILFFLDPTTNNKFLKILRRIMRKLTLKYIRI